MIKNIIWWFGRMILVVTWSIIFVPIFAIILAWINFCEEVKSGLKVGWERSGNYKYFGIERLNKNAKQDE
jgi:hypothetical protein